MLVDGLFHPDLVPNHLPHWLLDPNSLPFFTWAKRAVDTEHSLDKRVEAGLDCLVSFATLTPFHLAAFSGYPSRDEPHIGDIR